MKRTWILAVLTVSLCAGAWGATYTWNGGTSTYWNVATNWAGSAVPVFTATDTLIINCVVNGYSPDLSTVPAYTLDLNTLTISSGTLTLPGNVNFSINPGTGGIIPNLTINSGTTLTSNIALAVTNFTNNGTLDIKGNNLTVTPPYTNTGTIMLYGTAGQITGFTGNPGGTIDYYNANSGSQANWAFGYTYNNLTVENSTTMVSAGANPVAVNGLAVIGSNITTAAADQTYTGAVTLTNDVNFTANAGRSIIFQNNVTGQGTPRNLTITSANTEFHGLVSNAGSVTVTAGTTTINGDIVSTGSQTYAAVVLDGVSVITSSGGSVTMSGVVSQINGSGVSIYAQNGILLNNNNNTFGGTVVLNNNQGTAASRSGAVWIATRSAVTVSGSNTAAGAATGGADPDGFFIVDTSANNQNITIGGAVNCYLLDLKAGSGNVIINNTITATNATGIEGEGIAAVYVSANTMSGTGNIVLPAGTSEVCVNIDSTPSYSGTVTGTPPRIHYHSRTGHIVYRQGIDPGTIPGVTGSYLYFNSDNIRGYSFQPAAGYNLYIIDVGNLVTSAANTFNTI
ncbi:MAG: hypothetical protein FWF22_02030, partial [Treponema sp.]|nr:hypothetical protein [Treponema sp.]